MFLKALILNSPNYTVSDEHSIQFPWFLVHITAELIDAIDFVLYISLHDGIIVIIIIIQQIFFTPQLNYGDQQHVSSISLLVSVQI